MGIVDDVGMVILDFLENQAQPLAAREDDPSELNEDALLAALDIVELLLFGEEIDEVDAEVIAQTIEERHPGDEVLGALFNGFEETFLASLKNEGTLTPGNVEDPLTDLEGSAAGVAVGVNLLVALIETIPGEDIDAGTQAVAQVLSFQGAENLLGREIDATLQEGVDPALKQKVHADHRSKQADFQDFVEANLRQKATDPDVDPRDTPLGDGIESLLHPDDLGYLAEPEEYGTRPGQEGLYELDGLNVNEPEEIIEEPIQYGIPVPLRPVEQITELAGQPEDVKQIYKQVIEELPKSENLLQDYARLTEFNFRLREKVQEGAVSPGQAGELIFREVEDLLEDALPEDRLREEDRSAAETAVQLSDELFRNFRLLQSIPDDPPTFSGIERAYREGVISAQRYNTFHKEFGPKDRFFGMKLVVQDIRTGADDIARQEALGRLSTSEATAKLERIGFSNTQAAEILAGADPDEIVARTQESRETPDALPAGKAPEIGDDRAAVLSQIGISTVADVAEAEVEDLTGVTNMSNEQAQQAIEGSQRIVELAT